MSQHWQLFIDESGNFDDEEDRHLIAGILVGAAYHPDQESALRDAIAHALPGLRYPPHAWLLQQRRPTGRLFGYLQSDEQERPEAIEAVCAPALRALEHVDSSAFELLHAAADGEREPSLKLLQRCDDALSCAAPQHYSALRRLVEGDIRSFRGILLKTSEIVGADRVLVVAASRAPGVKGEGEEDDPYLALLVELFERVLTLFRSHKEEAVNIRVTAATRHISRPALPRRVPLFLQDLVRASLHAEDHPLLRPERREEESARLRPQIAPPRYDERVHPGVVLADFVANRLRRLLRNTDRNKPWNAVARDSRKSFALPIEAVARGLGPDRLPCVGASGAAHEALLRGAIDDKPVDLSSIDSRWERDQARRWVEAIGRAREEGRL